MRYIFDRGVRDEEQKEFHAKTGATAGEAEDLPDMQMCDVGHLDVSGVWCERMRELLV